jgi:hypothetical protein
VSEPQDEEVPIVEGPEPRHLADAAPALWGTVENIEAIGRLTAALNGPADGNAAEYQEVRTFLHAAAASERSELAAKILHAYRIVLPPEPEPATEAAGGFRGDSSGPGDRDNV